MSSEQELLLAGRIMLGGVAAIFGLNHFMKIDQMVGWAESKGVPAARLTVLFSGGLLIFAGLGLILNAAPVLSIGALGLFIIASSFKMHDFWNMEGEDKQNNMINFMKNMAMIGGLLILAAVIASGRPIDYGIGLQVL